MKKTYIKPQTLTVAIHNESAVLNLSGFTDPNNPYNEDGAWIMFEELPDGMELD